MGSAGPKYRRLRSNPHPGGVGGSKHPWRRVVNIPRHKRRRERGRGVQNSIWRFSNHIPLVHDIPVILLLLKPSPPTTPKATAAGAWVVDAAPRPPSTSTAAVVGHSIVKSEGVLSTPADLARGWYCLSNEPHKVGDAGRVDVWKLRWWSGAT